MVKDYGVWRAKPVSYTFEDRVADPHSPHLSLYFDNGQGAEGQAAINIKSGNKNKSRLAYWTVPDFVHNVTTKLAQLSNGFHPLAGASDQRLNGLALDYIR
ncbi:yukJ, partial [Fusarium circinatum]